MVTFALLEHRSLRIADLPDYVQRIPILRDINNRYLAIAPEHFAEWLVHELERARAVRREDGNLVPLVAA
ncbi:MAG: fold metallo-hydrolase [Proteobacteria bacterium]|nr:fold metallo-hydrolase [Pseudomonadota bacterium]